MLKQHYKGKEETGYLVSVIKQYLQMNEYYEEYKYIDYFFVCEVVAIFVKHQEYAAINEEKRGAYLREYTALCEYLNLS